MPGLFFLLFLFSTSVIFGFFAAGFLTGAGFVLFFVGVRGVHLRVQSPVVAPDRLAFP